MTIRYTDFAAGNDGNSGVGGWVNAKQNIQAHTPVLGDEIRVAKSPDPVALSGTLSWTDGSTTVTTSVDLTGVLAARDMIGKIDDGSDGWWEISTINPTTIVLTSTYAGTTEVVSSYMLDPFDVGSPATATTTIQAVPSVNLDEYDGVLITGGWDTGLDVQNGYSHYWVSGATKNGRFNFANTGYTVSRIGMHRCSVGFNMANTFNKLNEVWVGNTNSNSVALAARRCRVNQMISVGSVGMSSTVTQNSGIMITNCDIRTTTSSSISLGNSPSWIEVVGCTIRRPGAGSALAISVTGSITGHVSIRECSVSGGTTGYSVTGPNVEIVNSTSIDMSSADISGSPLEARAINCLFQSATPIALSAVSRFRVDHAQQVVGDHSLYHPNGTIMSNDTEAQGGTGKCVEMQPSDGGFTDARYLTKSFKVPLVASETRNVSVYIKKSVGWTGTVAYFGIKARGEWVSGPVDIFSSITTSYNEFTDSYLATDDETAEIVLEIDGSSGSVFIDDVTWT